MKVPTAWVETARPNVGRAHTIEQRDAPPMLMKQERKRGSHGTRSQSPSESRRIFTEESERIQWLVSQTNFVMQMSTGDPPGRPHIADNIPLEDALTGLHRAGLQVSVSGRQAKLVLDHDHVAVTQAPARVHHKTVGGGNDFRALRCGNIDPRMKIVFPRERIFAPSI